MNIQKAAIHIFYLMENISATIAKKKAIQSILYFLYKMENILNNIKICVLMKKKQSNIRMDVPKWMKTKNAWNAS